MLIGLISDTHVPVRARQIPGRVFEIFSNVDVILHSGDLVDMSVLLELSALAPVEAVAGNVDYPEVRGKLERRRLLRLEGVSIGLIHGDGPGWDTPSRAFSAFQNADCVVFGHSHRALVEVRAGVLLVNPGSAAEPRGLSEPTVGLLRVQDRELTAQIIGLHSGSVQHKKCFRLPE